MNKFIEFFVVLGFGFLFSLLISYPLMLLWNQFLVPAVNVLEPITWIQMFGISILINVLTRDDIKLKLK